MYVKRKKTFYFNSENQRGYLTDFPFVLLIVLMKPKKPKIFVLFSTVCAQLHAFVLSLLKDDATFLFSLLLSPFLSLPRSLLSPCSLLDLHRLFSSKRKRQLWPGVRSDAGYQGVQAEIQNSPFVWAISVRAVQFQIQQHDKQKGLDERNSNC